MNTHEHEHGHEHPTPSHPAAASCATGSKQAAGCTDCGTVDLSFGKRKAAPADAHDHSGHDHAHDGHGEHDDHGHDHGALPGWGRIGAALVAAVVAEACHWASGQPGSANYQLLHYGGMALALVQYAVAMRDLPAAARTVAATTTRTSRRPGSSARTRRTKARDRWTRFWFAGTAR